MAPYLVSELANAHIADLRRDARRARLAAGLRRDRAPRGGMTVGRLRAVLAGLAVPMAHREPCPTCVA